MSTQAQIDANRRNAQKSTGPRTDDGKAVVRQNALRHGLCSCMPLMDDEKVSDFKGLLEVLREENQPVGANEEIFVFKMAEHFFHMKRVGYLIAEDLDAADSGENIVRTFALLLRYHGASDRGFNQNFRELQKLQKERKLQEIGFDPQAASETPAEPPAAPPAPPATPADAPKKEPVAATKPIAAPIPMPFVAQSPVLAPESAQKTASGPSNTPPEAA